MAEDAVESVVQYDIFSDAITLSSLGQPGDKESHLQELRIRIFRELEPLLEGYVWQSLEGFNLEVVRGRKPSGESGLWHLAGRTRFGDNIEDEWFIVYLLKTVSEKIAGVSITVRDEDGEFLLIEAAYAIPRWLKPENSLNRVFLRDGWVHLVRRAGRKVGEKLGSLTVEEAVGLMKDGRGATRASERVQEAIAKRIGGYPEQARRNMHRARCVVPVPVAQVLKHEPQLVSLAVEAFYRRDVDAMKAATRLERFLPVQGSDAGSKGEMVEVLVTMSRAMYAQLHQQMFAAPRKYPMPAVADPTFKQAELGMKLTCGFEMMYWERQRFETEDVLMSDEGGNLRGQEQDLVGDPGWEVYRKSLENSGYFRDLLEGSREHKQLLQAAILDYRQTPAFAATSAARQTPVKRVEEILALQHAAADFSGSPLPESDSDAWLYDGEGDLTSAIRERQAEIQAEIEAHESRGAMRQDPDGSTGRDTSDAQPGGTADEPLYDPEELVQGIQAFMSKISSYEGAELPGDEAVSISMSRFMTELESALGSNAAADMKEDGLDDSDWETESDDSDEEMPADDNIDELRASSSLGVQAGDVASTSKGSGDFMDEYSEALQHELQQSSLAKSFAVAEKDEPDETSGSSSKTKLDEDDGAVDVDINLVTSLLQSFMNQEGMPGPASNLLGALGIQLVDPNTRNSGKSTK